jgi:hypothetical protein
MFPYIATEKDCVDEDGNDAECVICFEEFQTGDKMARLVCWCKFHEVCNLRFPFSRPRCKTNSASWTVLIVSRNASKTGGR